MPCLFPGIHFPGNQYSHFSMFGKHKESWSKESEFQSKKKKGFMAGKCFPFLILRKTLSFFFLLTKHALSQNTNP
jgi:hypothetical protein